MTHLARRVVNPELAVRGRVYLGHPLVGHGCFPAVHAVVVGVVVTVVMGVGDGWGRWE